MQSVMDAVDCEGLELRYGSEKGFVLVYEKDGSVAREMDVDIEYVESRDRYRLVQEIDHGDGEYIEMRRWVDEVFECERDDVQVLLGEKEKKTSGEE